MKKLIAVLLSLILAGAVFAVSASGDSAAEECRTGLSSSSAEGTISNQEAAEGYIRNALYSLNTDRPNAVARSNAVGTRFTGSQRKLYDALRPLIVRTAAGQNTSSEFYIPLGSLMEEKRYTIQELGYSSVTPGNMEQIFSDYYSETGFLPYEDIHTVIRALLSDMPYELYWFDKTAGWSVDYTAFPGIDANGTVGYDDFDSAKIDIKMYVSADFSKSGEAKTFELSPSLGQSVQRAVANIKEILQSNKDKSDYEKMRAYRDWINSHVDYNWSAAEDISTPYGNPWQLLWAFDGDDSTQVVCEGYSKAFKYLCDLTAFRGSVSVICVSGDLSDPYGLSGSHMWNVVALNDGKRYLVDITNDHQSYSLFLVGYKNTRVLEDGRTAYQYGDLWYSYSPETTNLFNPSELAVAEGGSYSGGSDPAEPNWKDPVYTWADDYTSLTALLESKTDEYVTVLETVSTILREKIAEANCTEGEKTRFTSDCFQNGYFVQQNTTVETVPALGHDWGEPVYTWNGDYSSVTASRVCRRDEAHTESETVNTGSTVSKAPTCTEQGDTTYTASFSNEAFSIQSQTLTNLDALGHDWNEPTYTWSGDCSSVTASRVCKRDETHTETETANTGSTVSKAPTCTDQGETTYTASFSSEAFSAQTQTVTNLNALGHDWDDGEETKPATYTEDGIKTFTCKRCGEKREEAISMKIPLGQTGWVSNADGTWSYGNAAGDAAVGPVTIDGTAYCFNEQGKMITGWAEFGGKWYYADTSGKLYRGWKEVGKIWYYFHSNGEMATGWVNDGGKYYYMKADGSMATGWVEDEGKWYNMNKDGAMKTGWMKDGKTWYLLKSSGEMATGWTKDGGTWYYFTSSGAMKTGWYEEKESDGTSSWYWFDKDGSMATGWKEIDKKWEFFDNSGVWQYTWDGK